MQRFKLKPCVMHVIHALALLSLAAPLATYAQDATDLGAVGTSDGSGAATGGTSRPVTASTKAPVQSSLEVASATSVVSEEFIRDFTSPVADFSQAIQMAPGLYSYSVNGPGLGDTKTFFRGFSDGDYTISFDGIPFQDSNSPTHHSWAFFPSQFLGGAVIDRSPGTASTVGPTNYGGSINLLSRNLEPGQRATVAGSYGSWNTRMFGGEYETGQFGPGGSSNLLVNIHEMDSDGYQTYNNQRRDAFSAKYQFALSEDTAITAFASAIRVGANTPNTKGPTRAQVAQLGDNYLMSNNPTRADYYGYNNYDVNTNFEYLGVESNLGNGWKVDDKLYTYTYRNGQKYNSSTTISATSATDKLNSYTTYGNILRLSQDSKFGTFRTGLWSEKSDTNRYQTPADPRTWVDAALPNFHETYTTTLLQPFVEYEFKATDSIKITPGLKYSSYSQDFTQFADNGKTIGTAAKIGGPSISHTASYSDVLPFLSLHYMIQPNWSIYGQYATGDEVPSTNVFDVPKANDPQPPLVKNRTFQIGSVWKSDRFTLDVDVYRIAFDNGISSFTDAAGNTTYYSSGKSLTQGIEAETNIILGGGFSTYLNATYGSAKYDSGTMNGQWIANAPDSTQTVSLNYEQGGWNTGIFAKRVGTYYQDNGTVHQAVAIDSYVLTNLFVNYRLKLDSMLAKQAKLQLGVNNLFNNHNIVAVTPASSATSVASPGDIVQLLPDRSVSLALTLDF